MHTPTPSELEILNVLWKLKEATTQTVNTALNTERKVGYTSTLKIMQLMTQKGLLDRRKEGKSHIYFPLLEQTQIQGNLLQTFVKNTFGGSSSSLMLQLLGNKDVSQDELKQIKDLIENMEDGNNG
jgi:predicted transcriptional regulator